MNEISKINSKELQNFKNKNEYIFINFDYVHSIKISFFYEKMKRSRVKELIKLFYKLTNIEIRTDDTLGKLHLILLELLINREENTVFISDIGFPKSSYDFLIDNLKKIFDNLDNLKNKKIVIVECHLNDPENLKYLEEYFQ